MENKSYNNSQKNEKSSRIKAIGDTSGISNKDKYKLISNRRFQSLQKENDEVHQPLSFYGKRKLENFTVIHPRKNKKTDHKLIQKIKKNEEPINTDELSKGKLLRYK